MRTYADPVHWIVETSTIGNVWVCAGSYLSITFDNFTSDALQVSFSGSTTTLAMSYFGNFVSALNSSTGAPPAYSPPLGTGDRRSIITVSATVKHRSNFSGGVLADLVDGSRSSPNINFGDPDNAYIAPNVAGLYLRFDFGTFQIMTECTVYWTLTSSRLHGIWQWQGSADGSSWTNIGSTFDASTSNVYTSLSANTSSYRYYQIMGVSGDSGGTVFGPSCAEFEFKIGALAGNDVVKSADDSTVKLNETHSVRGLTHHIRDAILWAVDDVGDFYEMVSPASALTLVGPTGVGVAYSMQRDGDQQQVLYLAGSAGLYASFNMGRTWHQLRDYSGVGLDGLALGYGLLGGKSLVAVTVYSIVTVPVKTLWNGVSNDAQPTGWKDASYDASAWSSAVEAAHTGSVLSDAAAKAIWKTTPAVSTTEQNLFRQEFTLGLGRITSANITVNLKDSATIWINGAFLTNAIHSTSGVEYSIDSLMLKSGVNLIEAYVINTADTEAWVAWKLVVA